jgi:hypothetical protein
MSDIELISKYRIINDIFKKYNYKKNSINLGLELNKLEWLGDFIEGFGFQHIYHLKYYFSHKLNYFELCDLDGCFRSKLIKKNYAVSYGCSREHSIIVSNIKKYGVSNVFQLESIKNKIQHTNIDKYGVKFAIQSDEVKNKVKQTNIKKYGVDVPAKSEYIVRKMKETNLRKYGVDGYTKTDEYKSKVKKTNLEKYGVDSYTKTDEYKSKVKKTNLEKYGVEYTFQSKEIKHKVKQTNINKYGVDSYTKTDEYKSKVKKTNLEKYGFQWNLQSNDIKSKIRQTNLDNYGVENISKRHLINQHNFTVEYLLDNFINDKGYFKSTECCEYFNCSITLLNKFKRENCILVPNVSNTKQTQRYIFELFDVTRVFDTKDIISPLELDIYYPKHKLAIEYNGLMFHSFGKSEYSMFNNYDDEKLYKLKHLNKTNLCNNQGVQLLHIFENEWLQSNTREIWKSIISNKLGLINNKVYARKCLVKEIDNKTKNEFLNTNHLQGEDISKIKLGLYYNDELVSVMTFGKSRFNKNYEYELIRFANKTNTNVIGGATKLFSHFKRNFNPKSIITFADKRYSDGNLYKVLGFNYLRESKPNYFYFTVNNLKLESRVQFQKHKLKDKLPVFDSNLTESENMFNNGYRRIWDCGNYVYGYKF